MNPFRNITTLLTIPSEDLTEGEIEYIRREAAYAAEVSVKKSIVQIKELRYAEQKVREAQSAETGEIGAGQEAVQRSFGEPGIPWDEEGTPRHGGSPWVPGQGPGDRGEAEARPQAQDAQTKGRTVRERYGCSKDPCPFPHRDS